MPASDIIYQIAGHVVDEYIDTDRNNSSTNLKVSFDFVMNIYIDAGYSYDNTISPLIFVISISCN